MFYVAGGGIDESSFSYDIAANTWTRMANLEQVYTSIFLSLYFCKVLFFYLDKMRDGNGLGMVGGVLTTFGGRYSGEVVTFEEFQGNRCVMLFKDTVFLELLGKFIFVFQVDHCG